VWPTEGDVVLSTCYRCRKVRGFRLNENGLWLCLKCGEVGVDAAPGRRNNSERSE